MTKKKNKKNDDKNILDNELEGIIINNEYLKTGMKKIINSIENKNSKSIKQNPKKLKI